RSVTKPSLSRAEKNTFTRLTLTLMVGASMSATGCAGASLLGGGALTEGASCAERGQGQRASARKSAGEATAARKRRRMGLCHIKRRIGGIVVSSQLSVRPQRRAGFCRPMVGRATEANG